MNIDTVNLIRLRHNYAICKRRLAIRNTNKLPTSVVMGTMNVVRGKLSREIKRISKLVWPVTGRPAGKPPYYHMDDSPVWADVSLPRYWLCVNISEDNDINTNHIHEMMPWAN